MVTNPIKTLKMAHIKKNFKKTSVSELNGINNYLRNSCLLITNAKFRQKALKITYCVLKFYHKLSRAFLWTLFEDSVQSWCSLDSPDFQANSALIMYLPCMGRTP